MSEPLPELAELREAIGDLSTAFQEFRDAQTAKEQAAAKEDIREAKADLDQIAKESGISRASIEKAVAEARRAERKEELRPILEELLAEAKEGDDDNKTNGDVKEPKAVKPPATPPPPKPNEDEHPTHEHWSERKLSELLR